MTPTMPRKVAANVYRAQDSPPLHLLLACGSPVDQVGPQVVLRRQWQPERKPEAPSFRMRATELLDFGFVPRVCGYQHQKRSGLVFSLRLAHINNASDIAVLMSLDPYRRWHPRFATSYRRQ